MGARGLTRPADRHFDRRGLPAAERPRTRRHAPRGPCAARLPGAWRGARHPLRRRLSVLQARIDRLALEGEDAEDALVYPAERLAADEPLERLDPQREFAERERPLPSETAF